VETFISDVLFDNEVANVHVVLEVIVVHERDPFSRLVARVIFVHQGDVIAQFIAFPGRNTNIV
jgi:hypothetical protein